jgi:hypothetical protein
MGAVKQHYLALKEQYANAYQMAEVYRNNLPDGLNPTVYQSISGHVEALANLAASVCIEGPSHEWCIENPHDCVADQHPADSSEWCACQHHQDEHAGSWCSRRNRFGVEICACEQFTRGNQ